MTLRSGNGSGASAAAPTSLTQWNNLQQQNAELVDLGKLIESIRATLRAGGVLYVGEMLVVCCVLILQSRHG